MRLSSGICAWLLSFALAWFAPAASSEDVPEYRLKAAFIYNFALLTDWPPAIGTMLKLCLYGKDRFGSEIDGLEGKAVGERRLSVHRVASIESLNECQIVFIADSASDGLPKLLDSLRGATVLTIADTPGAASQGVALNLSFRGDRITFEANVSAARDAHLSLSSKLLRLATEVRQ
jgi:hypothetical protein